MPVITCTAQAALAHEIREQQDVVAVAAEHLAVGAAVGDVAHRARVAQHLQQQFLVALPGALEHHGLGAVVQYPLGQRIRGVFDTGLRHVIGEGYAHRAVAGFALLQGERGGVVQVGMGVLVVPGLPRPRQPGRVAEHLLFLRPVVGVDQFLPDLVAVLGEHQGAAEVDHRGRRDMVVAGPVVLALGLEALVYGQGFRGDLRLEL
ncbi:hypothetical protein [Mangrovimicrobium sediminis]|uniref:hypothetical protein n=1 Tax=Mangrovimicrobium sediminis TaxID=2562682 RepID=UPI0033656A85